MPNAYFLVRAVVPPALRDEFDHWYATDHLPLALRTFQCEKAWRFWSTIEPNVHYAFYRFADMAKLDRAMKSDGLKAMIADFDRAFPTITRTRDILDLIDERDGISTP